MPKRTLQGIVTSNACNKTVTVKVERRLRHPVFGKFITRSKKYSVHDENNESKVGDKIFIRECRPISKHKCWEVISLPSSSTI